MSISDKAEALQHIRDGLLEHKYEEIEKLKSENAIPDENFIYEVDAAFQYFLTRGKIDDALELARKYDLPEDKTSKAALQQFWKYYKAKEYYKAAYLG